MRFIPAFSLTIATQAPAADAQPTALSQSEKSALESVGPGAVEPATPANEYGEGVRPSGPRTPAEEAAGFHLPPGFEAQLVAAEPDIAKPLNMAFDTEGRLWITNTLEYPYPAPADREPRDSIKVLDQFQPDGRAARISTFATGLNIRWVSCRPPMD